MTPLNSNLPLTPAVFHILLALSSGERHGYGVLKQVEVDSQGKVKIGAGTLYFPSAVSGQRIPHPTGSLPGAITATATKRASSETVAISLPTVWLAIIQFTQVAR